jgi:hypothetical protein
MNADKTEARMEMPRLAEEVEELAFLVPKWQIMALAEVAAAEGMTAAQLLRRLVNQALSMAPFPGKRGSNPLTA